MTDNHPSEIQGLAALAWDAYVRHRFAEAALLASRASSAASGHSRRERQVVEVVCLAVAGDATRAFGLAAEHLAEFPDDELVRRVRDACE